jgi:hypothetical protein
MNELLEAFHREPWYWQLVSGACVLGLIDWLLDRILSFRLTIIHKHIIEVKGCESTSK